MPFDRPRVKEVYRLGDGREIQITSMDLRISIDMSSYRRTCVYWIHEGPPAKPKQLTEGELFDLLEGAEQVRT